MGVSFTQCALGAKFCVSATMQTLVVATNYQVFLGGMNLE